MSMPNWRSPYETRCKGRGRCRLRRVRQVLSHIITAAVCVISGIACMMFHNAADPTPAAEDSANVNPDNECCDAGRHWRRSGGRSQIAGKRGAASKRPPRVATVECCCKARSWRIQRSRRRRLGPRLSTPTDDAGCVRRLRLRTTRAPPRYGPGERACRGCPPSTMLAWVAFWLFQNVMGVQSHASSTMMQWRSEHMEHAELIFS